MARLDGFVVKSARCCQTEDVAKNLDSPGVFFIYPEKLTKMVGRDGSVVVLNSKIARRYKSTPHATIRIILMMKSVAGKSTVFVSSCHLR